MFDAKSDATGGADDLNAHNQTGAEAVQRLTLL
jgi:hypothetical protein